MSTSSRIPELDKLLQHRTKLGACVLLTRHDAMAFVRLRDLLGETDGNLSVHLRKLEDAGYVSVHKEFAERKPQSWYALTETGRKHLSAHLKALEEYVSAAAGGEVPWIEG